jgi:hypothetical protein
MTNTKWLSALLAGTALTVASTAAMADTSLVTMTRNAAGEGVTFKIAPTADMPASAAEVTVAGEVRALLTSAKATVVADDTFGLSDGDRQNDLGTRARIFIKGKTETSVGVVGANLRVQDSNGSAAKIDEYTGYWEFAPGMTLTAGKAGSISSVDYGADANGTGGVWAGVGAGLTNPSVEQVNVSLATGPITMAFGVEDNTSASQFDSDDGEDVSKSNPGIAGTMNFSSGDFGAQIAGRTQSFDTEAGTTTQADSGYMIGGGLGYSAGAFGLEIGAATGRGLSADYVSGAGDLVDAGADLTDDKFMAASILGTFSMTETTSVELWYGQGKVSNLEAGTKDAKVSGYGAGVFWNPVSQLRLGVGGDMTTVKIDTVEVDVSQVGVGAWFKF